jgi:hypothetical protein
LWFYYSSITNFDGLIAPSQLTLLRFYAISSPTVSLSWSGTLPNLDTFTFQQSSGPTSLSFDFSATKLGNGSNLGSWSPTITNNANLVTIDITLPTVTNTLKGVQIQNNVKLTSIIFPSNTHLSSYTTPINFQFSLNALTYWPYYAFPNTTNGIQMYSNRRAGIANSGFALGFNVDFTNLTSLVNFQVQENSLTNLNTTLTNFTNATNLITIYLFDNKFTSIPALPNTTNNLDLQINKNLLNITSASDTTSLPSLPAETTTFIVGSGQPNVETNRINVWPTSVSLSSTIITTFQCEGVGLSGGWDKYLPSTLTSFKFSYNTGLTTFDFTYISNSTSNTTVEIKGISATILDNFQNVNLGTKITSLDLNSNKVNDPNKFFYPSSTSSTRYFPPNITILKINNNRILNSLVWNRGLFSFGVVNQITSVDMSSMDLKYPSGAVATSVNYILKYFYDLCTTSPAGATGVSKAQSCAPNLITLTLSLNIPSNDTFRNAYPDTTSGGIDGTYYLSQLLALGITVT